MTELELVNKQVDPDVDPAAEKYEEEEMLDSDSEMSDCDDESDEEPKKLTKKEMYGVTNSVEFLDRSWGTFSLFFGLYYILQFGLALCAANMYAHSSGLNVCDISVTEVNEAGISVTTSYDAEQSKGVYDTALLLMGLYHIIEWFRTILLLTVTCMKYEILMYVYNALFVNLIFGVIVALYAHVARFGEYGTLCAAEGAQPERAQFLLAEIIFFYILYIISGVFIFAFPKMSYELAMMSWTKRENKRQAASAEREAAKIVRRAAKKAEVDARAKARQEDE